MLRRGHAFEIVKNLTVEAGAGFVFWNRCYEPSAVARDRTLKETLTASGVTVQSFNASLLAEPWEIKTAAGTPFQVFTPFWRALRSRDIAPPLRTPAISSPPAEPIESDTVADWQLLPTQPDWAGGLRQAWTPGEAGARKRLQMFLTHPLADYKTGRDRPDMDGTSQLSPYLHFGEISPRQIWHTVSPHHQSASAEKFLSKLGWREFSNQLLYFHPDLPDEPLDEKFAHYPWSGSDAQFGAWCRGCTGIPMVDAGMRQLWTTGWMHNRVRMIVASFLIKHLAIDWRRGERWFWDTLVDADLANNAASWQWVAGCGADAAPFFRIFNPVLQGEKLDPEGNYVRRWVPEIANLPQKFLHKPWQAPVTVLAAAGVTLGQTYPAPIVDLATARDHALAIFRALARSG